MWVLCLWVRKWVGMCAQQGVGPLMPPGWLQNTLSPTPQLAIQLNLQYISHPRSPR